MASGDDEITVGGGDDQLILSGQLKGATVTGSDLEFEANFDGEDYSATVLGHTSETLKTVGFDYDGCKGTEIVECYEIMEHYLESWLEQGLILSLSNTFRAKCWIFKTKEEVLGGHLGIPMEMIYSFWLFFRMFWLES